MPRLGNRRYIHPAQKELLVTMSTHMKTSEIEAVTGISQRTVQRVLRIWSNTGQVVCKPNDAGRPRKLDDIDVLVRNEALFMVFLLKYTSNSIWKISLNEHRTFIYLNSRKLF